jgi:hypothetical protein
MIKAAKTAKRGVPKQQSRLNLIGSISFKHAVTANLIDSYGINMCRKKHNLIPLCVPTKGTT